MKSFSEYITERTVKLSLNLPYAGAVQSEIRGLDSPSVSEITGFAKNAPQNKLRFLCTSKGRLTVWRAIDGIHQQVIHGEMRDDEDFLDGNMTLLGKNSWDVYISPHPRANIKFAKKSSTLQDLLQMSSSGEPKFADAV